MKKLNIRRVLTFIFTLTFIISTVMGTLPAFSLSSDKTDSVVVTSGSYWVSPVKATENKVNVLKGITPYLNEYVAPAGTVDAADKSSSDAGGALINMIDGNFATEWAPGGHARPFHNANGDWFLDGRVQNKLAFDLGKETDITDILVAHSSTNGLSTGAYKVYVSSKSNDLFDAANLVADVKNNVVTYQNVISTKSGKTLKGQYLGIIVTNPGNDHTAWNSSKGSYYARIKEIAVFAADTTTKTPRGTVTDISDSAELPELDSANGELNLTTGRTYKYFYNLMGDGADIQIDSNSIGKYPENLTNGATNADAQLYGFRFYNDKGGATGDFTNGRASVALTFDLGLTFELTKFTLINGANNALATSHYMVYASNDENKLFDVNSFVAEVKNPNGDQRNVITFNDGVKARYVGVRIYDPCSDYTAEALVNNHAQAYPRINELAVYGKTLEVDNFTATADDEWTTDTSLGKDNVLAGKKPETIKMHRPSGVDTSYDTEGRLTDGDITTDAGEWRNSSYKFTDGSKVIGNGIALGDYYLDITFNLGGTYKITGFEVFNSKSSAGGLATHKYQVYASMNSADLYAAANLIADYTNDKKAHNAFSLSTGKAAPEAKYYGIRILDPTCSKETIDFIYPRIRELTLYGERIVSAADAIIIDETAELPTTYEGTNLAPNAAFENKFFNLDGKYNAVPSNGDSILTDGKFNNDYRTSSALFATNSKWLGNGIAEGEIYQDLTFDLSYIANITGLVVMNHSSDNLATYKYNIYFSNTKADLFTGEPFYKMVNEGGKQRNAFDISMLNNMAPKAARFVGIRVIDPTTKKPTEIDGSHAYLRLLEIAIFGTLTTEGGDPKIPVKSDNQAKIPTDFEGENIALQAKQESWYKNPASKQYVKVSAEGESAIEHLTDGNPATEFRTSSNKFAVIDTIGTDHKWLGNGLSEGDVYQDVIVDLNYISVINAISVISSPTNGLANKKYALYFGNVKKELFNGTPLYTMDNSAGDQRQTFDVKELNGNQPITARFVGIRVLDATAKKPPVDVDIVNCYLRLREVSVFGSLTSEGADPPPDLNLINDDVIALPTDWGTNIALGKQPKTYVQNRSGYNATSPKNPLHLSDGDVKSEFEEQSKLVEINDAGALAADHTYYGFGDWYTDIVYDFLTEVNVDAYTIIHHSNPSMIARRYAIYVGDKKSTLFNEGNKVYEVVNEEPFRRNGVNLKGKGLEKTGRYVAIRVLAPSANPSEATDLYGMTKNNKNEPVAFNQVHTRLMEFAIYGSYVDPNFVYKPDFTPMHETPEDSYFNGNLLLHKMANEIYYNSQRYAGLREDDKLGVITNGLAKTPYGEEIDPDGNLRQLTHFDFGTLTFTAVDGSQTVDFYWDLKKSYEFSKFAMLSSVGAGTSHYTGWYRLYVSDDLDLLFDDSSIAFEYNAVDEEEPDEICRGQEKVFDTPVVGRYMAIRILNPVYTATQWVRPRIVEVGIWGKEAILDKTPTNLSSDMPVNAYLGDLGDLEEVDSLTLKDLRNLTDNKNTTGASIKTGGEKLHVIYNLCQDVEIYNILIKSLKGKASLKNYKIYASDTQTGVWTDKALVYTHKGKSADGEKKFTIPKVMRYVRIEILDKAQEIFLGDVQIIGPKYRALRNKNLNKNLGDPSYTVFVQNKKTGKIEYIEPEKMETKPKMMHDGATNFATALIGGVKGKSTLNITIDLGDIRNVNSVRLDFPKRSEPYLPTKTHIYFGSDANEIEKLDAKPAYTFDKVPANRYFAAEFIPRTGRFIRISFADAPDNGILEEMIIALTEITINGTAVVGMNGDSKNVMDFEDKDLGIKWGIVKATNNDVLNDVATSKVVVKKSTNWQKRSLEKNPYLKVVGGKNYTFKFYDITGNEIKDLEGRDIEVSFKLKSGMTGATTMIGYSGSKWYIQPYETTTDKHKGYATSYAKTDLASLTFSLLEIVSSDDDYWSTIGALEDYGDEKPENAPEEDLNATTSFDPIVTEDGDFSVEPTGTLQLPVSAQLFIDYNTYFNFPLDVYEGVLPHADPNNIAVTYYVRLVESDIDYIFDGKIKVMLTIPEVAQGFYSGYKLVHIHDDGNSELVDFTIDDDKIYFETRSLSKFVLVGDNSVVNEEIGDSGNDELGEQEGIVDGDASPSTGEKAPVIYFIVSLLSLAAIVIINSKKLFTV